MPDNNENSENIEQCVKPIVVSSKLLTHVSDGIYRSPGNALKELVSNAFDADAKAVRINTNYPEFDVITCSDDGVGMTLDQFEKLMGGGIGDSHKREGEDIRNQETKKTQKKRPIIGKLGIGMLAIAQICYDFTVISHHKGSKSAFKATINLNPRRSLEADEKATKEKVVAAEKTAGIENPKENLQINKDVGYYSAETIDYDEKQAGLLITTSDLKPVYTKQYRSDVKKENFKKIPKNFETYIKEVSKNTSVARKGAYWELFWDLALASPIPYLEKGPFNIETIKTAVKQDSRKDVSSVQTIIQEIKEEVKGYEFTVFLDGVKLYRPVLLPNPKALISSARLTPVDFDDKIGGLPLKFKGYMFTQGKAIYPEDLRGILIRVRNTAIGNYDKTLLKYDTVLGFKADWFSGEIIVNEGLEGALNIDRNSFNEVHEHYQFLKRKIHEIIREESVFGEAQKREIADVENSVDTSVENKIARKLNRKYSIRRKTLAENIPILLDIEKKEIILNRKCVYWDSAKSKRFKGERAMIALALAQQYNEEDFNQIFLSLIQEIV